jgi:hypothetical protein
MRYNKYNLLFLFTVFSLFENQAQISYTVETGSLISGGDHTPAWLISNEYGEFSMEKFQYFLSTGLDKKTDYSKKFNYGFGLELYNRFDADKTNIFGFMRAMANLNTTF